MTEPPSQRAEDNPAEDNPKDRARWSELAGPGAVLVWLLIALAVIEIFLQAQFVVVHLFNVIVLFIFAAVIALSLTPVVDFMQRAPGFRSRRLAPVVVLYSAVVGGVGGVIALLVPSIIEEGRQLPTLVNRVQDQLDRLPVRVHLPSGSGLAEGGLGSALGVVSGTVTGIVDLILVIVISIYFLIGGRELIAAVRKLFEGHSHVFDFTLLAIGGTIAKYVRGQLLMSFLMGAYTGIVMALLGVHYAIGLGAAAAILEFLPMIGAPIAMSLAVVVALFQSPLLAVFAGIAGLVGHALDAYIVGPRVNAHVVRLHPLVALAALLFGAEIGGILGALFAVPVAAVVNIFLGAYYRSRRGEAPFSTAEDTVVDMDNLPRLGDEIKHVEDDGEIVSDPVPRVVATKGVRGRGR